MKLFAFLSTIAFSEAALSATQKNAATNAFKKWDRDHKGYLTSGGVYGALASLDHKLTEAQLQKAAGHNKVCHTIFFQYS